MGQLQWLDEFLKKMRFKLLGYFIILFGCSLKNSPLKDQLLNFSESVDPIIFENFFSIEEILESDTVTVLSTNAYKHIGYCGIFFKSKKISKPSLSELSKMEEFDEITKSTSECIWIAGNRNICDEKTYPIPDLTETGPLSEFSFDSNSWIAYTLNYEKGAFLNDLSLDEESQHAFSNGLIMDLESGETVFFIMIW